MFRRLIFADSASWFTLVAFITAASIFVNIAWRALRMSRAKVRHFSELPFSTATPPAADDNTAAT